MKFEEWLKECVAINYYKTFENKVHFTVYRRETLLANNIFEDTGFDSFGIKFSKNYKITYLKATIISLSR